MPTRHSFELSVAIPASFVYDVPHLREKTFRIGLIGRAAAIFRVDEVIIYPDMPSVEQKSDIRLIHTILSYMETPQYLRRRLFRIEPELQYAGTLPPLRTPHHPTANKVKGLKLNEFREGVVLSRTKEGVLVDIGVEQPALLREALPKNNSRITVKITELKQGPKAVLVNKKDIQTYWGYTVSVAHNRFGQIIREGKFDLAIATSRRGRPFNSVLDELGRAWRNSRKTLVAFGAPTQGLYEIAARERVNLDDLAHFVVNAIPNQATETVRTEEAMYATLSILNMSGS